MALIALPVTIFEMMYGGSVQPTSPIPALTAEKFQISVSGSANLIAEISLTGKFEIRIGGQVNNAIQSYKISSLSQSLTPEALVSLFELDLSKYNLGIVRFSNEANEIGGPLRYGGRSYYPMPIEASGFERRGEGASARPRISLSVVTPAIIGLIIEGQDLCGCQVTRTKTFRRFLDDGIDPSTDDHFPVEVWRIERLFSMDNETVEFELASVLDVEQKMLPGRQIIRDYCTFIYRYWNGSGFSYDKFNPCPYTGANAYDKNGTRVAQNKDVCAKHLKDCRLRFPGDLPFGGFPGVNRVK